MIQLRFKILNWSLITLFIYILCGVQTSLWFQFASGTPAPQFWLVVLLYLVLYRSYIQALTYSYFLAFIIKSFSSASLSLLLPLFFILVSPASYIKGRMFWPSTRYFLFATFIFTLSFHVLSIFLSYYIENTGAPLALTQRAIEITLTLIAAAPIYWVMNFIDQITIPDVMSSQGARE